MQQRSFLEFLGTNVTYKYVSDLNILILRWRSVDKEWNFLYFQWAKVSFSKQVSLIYAAENTAVHPPLSFDIWRLCYTLVFLSSRLTASLQNIPHGEQIVQRGVVLGGITV